MKLIHWQKQHTCTFCNNREGSQLQSLDNGGHVGTDVSSMACGRVAGAALLMLLMLRATHAMFHMGRVFAIKFIAMLM